MTHTQESMFIRVIESCEQSKRVFMRVPSVIRLQSVNGVDLWLFKPDQFITNGPFKVCKRLTDRKRVPIRDGSAAGSDVLTNQIV